LRYATAVRPAHSSEPNIMINRREGIATGKYAAPAPLDLIPAAMLWFPGHDGFATGGSPNAVLWGWQLLAGRGGPIHVLMIEDDPAIAEMYRVQLEHDGYRVSVATTAEVGLETLSEQGPDLVLLDLLLPDRSGFEMLMSLNENLPNHPPVVILSNYGEPSMIDRGRSLGAVEYLVKSRVTPSEISGQIPAWIEQGRRGRQGES
jgi:CheY-like chemotaxis protein